MVDRARVDGARPEEVWAQVHCGADSEPACGAAPDAEALRAGVALLRPLRGGLQRCARPGPSCMVRLASCDADCDACGMPSMAPAVIQLSLAMAAALVNPAHPSCKRPP